MGVKDITNKTYGKLTVVKFLECRGKAGHAYWLTLCVCGNNHIVRGSHLRSGEVTECSLCQANSAREKATTHGLTMNREGKRCKVFQAYLNIKKRCYDPNNKSYAGYGEKGIGLQTSWIDDPTAFVKYIGQAPSDLHSIERLDMNRGYEEGNIVWATPNTQSRNRRGCRSLPTCVYKKKHFCTFEKQILGKKLRVKFQNEDKELELFATMEYRDLIFSRINLFLLPENERYSDKHGKPNESIDRNND